MHFRRTHGGRRVPRTGHPTPHTACGSDRTPVPNPQALHRLFNDYAAISQRPATLLSDDARRSLIFFRYEQELASGARAHSTFPVRVNQWFAALAELEAFISAEGRWPRENNKAHAGLITIREKRSAVWVRTQRSAITRQRLCDYQIRRLAAIGGFSLRPIEDRWFLQLVAYNEFVSTNQRAPRLRADEQAESSLAAWASKQRLARRRGTLPVRRIAALERLGMWSWGEVSTSRTLRHGR
jgi:hypothetical protein